MISEWACVQVHTPQDKCPINDYSQQSLALLIPGSRLNTWNSPSTHPYCNRQLLKDFLRIERNRKNLTNTKIFTQIIFYNVKISQSTVHLPIKRPTCRCYAKSPTARGTHVHVGSEENWPWLAGGDKQWKWIVYVSLFPTHTDVV